MKKYRGYLILINLVVLLLYFNYSVYKKEQLSDDGKLILLELAPVDPRSLMQGDYMDLRYAIAQYDGDKEPPKKGFCVVKIDKDNVAKALRFQKNKTPLAKEEFLIEYQASSRYSIKIGAESYFFQEGHAERYEKAKYGGLKIDDEGNSLLIGLFDESKKLIQ